MTVRDATEQAKQEIQRCPSGDGCTCCPDPDGCDCGCRDDCPRWRGAVAVRAKALLRRAAEQAKSDRNTKVLCRAQGGEPVARTIVAHLPGAFEVMNPESGRRCLFPEVDAFEYDAELASRLSNAYGSGRADRLRELWADAKQLVSAPESAG